MSSVIEVIVDSDVIYEVTLDQPAPLYEVTISDTSPTYDVINFDPGILSLALIDDGTPTAFKAYSGFHVSQLLTGYSLTSHNHAGVYQPVGAYLTAETDPVFVASPANSITVGHLTILGNTSGTNTGDETASTIKTKLGITTLSGSNTGDQDLSGYQHTLTAGANITIDVTDPIHPIISSTSTGTTVQYGFLNTQINQLGGSF